MPQVSVTSTLGASSHTLNHESQRFLFLYVKWRLLYSKRNHLLYKFLGDEELLVPQTQRFLVQVSKIEEKACDKV